MTTHISAQQTARMLGIQTNTLAKWRRQGRGPLGWVKVSATLVIYPLEEVERFLAAKRAGVAISA